MGGNLFSALCTGTRLCPEARMFLSVATFSSASDDTMNTCMPI